MTQFRCAPRRLTMARGQCVELFVDTHASADRSSPCYTCSVGAAHRFLVAYGRPPSRVELARYLTQCEIGRRMGRPTVGKPQP